MLRVGMIGTGYVGLVSGTCLAELGHHVTCLDTDVVKIERLKQCDIPIYEPGLADLVLKNAKAARLHFTSDICEASVGADVLFIAVGTPSDAEGVGADLSNVYLAAEQAARAIAAAPAGSKSFTTIVTKSTVPVRTNWRIADIVGRYLPQGCFAIASNPEFLREGDAIADFMRPDRIVVGCDSPRGQAVLEALYLPLTRDGTPLIATKTVETAELIKYAANAFLATKVAFINELAHLCEATGADVKELALGVGLDSRIGTRFFEVGPGFGGSCFPKDLMALVKTGHDFGSPVHIVDTTIRANERHKQIITGKIRKALGSRLERRSLAVLGLAFKAGTDDMRNAPALTILPPLLREGVRVKAYDPAAQETARRLLPDVEYAVSIQTALQGADAAVILTEWSTFRAIDWKALGPTMRRPLVVDFRNLYDADEIVRCGIEYWPLGRAEQDLAYRAAAE